MTHVSLSKGCKLHLSHLFIRDLQKNPSLSTVSAWFDCSKAKILLQHSSSSVPGCSLLICNIAHVIIYFKCRRWKQSFVRHLHAGSCLLDTVTHWNSILPVKMLFKQTWLFWSASLSQALFNVTLKGNKEPCDAPQELALAAGSLYQL